MVDDNKTLNIEKIKEAYYKSIKLHLVLKNKDWRNGYVKELSADFFVFRDDVNGEQPIFFLELHKVEPYLKEKKEDD